MANFTGLKLLIDTDRSYTGGESNNIATRANGTESEIDGAQKHHLDRKSPNDSDHNKPELSFLKKISQRFRFLSKTNRESGQACEEAKRNQNNNQCYTKDATWFEENILDKDYGLKTIVADYFLQLSWISSFGVERPNERFGTIHLVITCKKQAEPVLNDLIRQFGKNISSFVEIREGRGQRRVYLTRGNSRSSSPPRAKSGDGVHGSNTSDCGTIGMFARNTEEGQDGETFAITCYHVLYEGKLNKDCELYPEYPSFLQLENDFDNPDSPTKMAHYKYRSATSWSAWSWFQPWTWLWQWLTGCAYDLGQYHWARYDCYHDIGLVKVNNTVKCNFQIQECENDRKLSRKGEIEHYFRVYVNEKDIPVRMNGYISRLREGKLVGCNYHMSAFRGDTVFYREAYKLESKEGGKLVEDGDSGSLVLWKDGDEKWRPFAYIVANVNENGNEFTIAYNLHDALQSYGGDITPLFNGAS